MIRADVDSVAIVTQDTLDAWRVPYAFYRSDEDVSRAFDQACQQSRPVALLVTETLC